MSKSEMAAKLAAELGTPVVNVVPVLNKGKAEEFKGLPLLKTVEMKS